MRRIDARLEAVRRQARLLPALAACTRAVRATLARWHRRARYRRALAQMSERELADISIAWPLVAEEVNKPFWRE